jgi:hypothetical protein
MTLNTRSKDNLIESVLTGNPVKVKFVYKSIPSETHYREGVVTAVGNWKTHKNVVVLNNEIVVEFDCDTLKITDVIALDVFKFGDTVTVKGVDDPIEGTAVQFGGSEYFGILVGTKVIGRFYFRKYGDYFQSEDIKVVR